MTRSADWPPATGRWLLCVGTAGHAVTGDVREACSAVAEVIAERGHSLLVGVHRGVDQQVARVFLETVQLPRDNDDEALKERFCEVVNEGEVPAFYTSLETMYVPNHEYDRVLDRVDALLVFGGADTARAVVSRARRRRLPILPFADLAGVSATAFAELIGSGDRLVGYGPVTRNELHEALSGRSWRQLAERAMDLVARFPRRGSQVAESGPIAVDDASTQGDAPSVPEAASVPAVSAVAPVKRVPALPSEPLRMLMVSSTPPSEQPLDVNREFTEIHQTFAGAASGRVKLVYVPDANLETVISNLAEHRPHILHFSGHCTSLGHLVLDQGDNQTLQLSPLLATALLNEFRADLRLVVFNACFTATDASIISNVIECVIGVPGRIEDGNAILFTRMFYSGLVSGLSVHSAYMQATIDLQSHGVATDMLPALHPRSDVEADKLVLLPRLIQR